MYEIFSSARIFFSLPPRTCTGKFSANVYTQGVWAKDFLRQVLKFSDKIVEKSQKKRDTVFTTYFLT